MEQSFWTDRWAEGQTGWHADQPNPFLLAHVDELHTQSGDAVLVPLCGKTLDLGWLEEFGRHPIGVEWAEEAVAAHFEDEGRQPVREPLADGVECWHAGGTAILCADWFAVTRDHLHASAEAVGARRPVRAWWDRAALIALPREVRARYAAHLQSLFDADARGLLLGLEYPQQELDGPPFSVEPPEVHTLFDSGCDVEELAWQDALPHSPTRQAQGLTRFEERLYRLRRR